nr:reverse transcriptase domain-containing protein [Tanacetum cinerariifolium]
MQTRSSSRLVSNPSSNPTSSTNPNPKGRNHRLSKQKIENPNLDDLSPPVVTMADQRTMAQLLQEPTEGYEDAIVVPAITADNFELKHGAARIWLDKEPPRSSFTWDNLVSKFINQFFHLSKTTNLHNEITNFQQRFKESFSEAWDRIKDLLRASIIESKSKVCYSHNKPVVAKVSTNVSTPGISHDVVELKDMVKALLLDKKSQNQSPALVKVVEESCVTCGGAHYYRNYPATDGNNYRDNIQEFVSQASTVNYNQGNTSYHPPMMSNQIRHHGFPSGNNFNQGPVYQPPVFQPPAYQAPAYQALAPQTQGVSQENFSAYVKANDEVVENEPEVTKDTVNPTNNENAEDVQPQAVQSKSLVLISKPVTSPISEPAIASVSTLKPNPKASIPYLSRRNDERNRMAECLALADLGASINLMPFSVWKRLSLPDLTPTCITLELADRSISRPFGVEKDVYVKVGSFYFLADFVVLDFDADPRVPLILGRSFLKSRRALIDVFEGELTLRVGKEAITFNLDQTSRYSANYSNMTEKRIDVIDMACEEYSQEVLGFSDTISSGNPALYYDLIVSATSSTLTPFENSYFLLEEGDILLLEAFLNDDPSLPPPNQRNYMPEVCKELKICEAKSNKSSVDEPPVVELKDLPPHLEYAFLVSDDKLPVIIVKDLSVEEKTALITVLKSHKRAITWKFLISREKSHFMVKEGIVLGHKISKQGIKVNKAKVDVITKLPYPTTVKGIRSFLGHAGFYRRFIKDFSKIARPMTRLLEKDTPFIFSQKCVDAFQTLKRKLTEAPILIAPDWDMPFELMCDASDFAIGTVLGQRQDKHFRPIHYASKTMTNA